MLFIKFDYTSVNEGTEGDTEQQQKLVGSSVVSFAATFYGKVLCDIPKSSCEGD